MDNNFSKALNYQKELRSIIHEGITVTVNNEKVSLPTIFDKEEDTYGFHDV